MDALATGQFHDLCVVFPRNVKNMRGAHILGELQPRVNGIEEEPMGVPALAASETLDLRATANAA